MEGGKGKVELSYWKLPGGRWKDMATNIILTDGRKPSIFKSSEVFPVSTCQAVCAGWQ